MTTLNKLLVTALSIFILAPSAFSNDAFIKQTSERSFSKLGSRATQQILQDMTNNNVPPLSGRSGETRRVRLEYPSAQTLIARVRTFDHSSFLRDISAVEEYAGYLRSVTSQVGLEQVTPGLRNILNNHNQLVLEGNARVQILLNTLEKMDEESVNVLVDPITKETFRAEQVAEDILKIHDDLLRLERAHSVITKQHPNIYEKLGLRQPSDFGVKAHPRLTNLKTGSVLSNRISKALTSGFASNLNGVRGAAKAIRILK